MQAGVDVAGPGAHDETLQRGEAHRGVDGASTAHGRGGAAVAEVQDHLAQVGERATEQVGRRRGDELVRGAVEAVAADRVRGRELAGHGIRRRLAREGGEEGRVEDGDVGHVEAVTRGLDAGHRGGIVQGRKRTQRFDAGDDGVVDEHGRREVGPAVDDAVPHGTQLHRREVDAVVAEPCCHLLDGGRVVGDAAAALADALDGAAGGDLARLGHDELVLQRRRPGVEHEDRAVGRGTGSRGGLLLLGRDALRLDGGDGHGVDDVVDEGAAGEVVDRLAQALQHRPDRDGVRRCAAPPCTCCCRC